MSEESQNKFPMNIAKSEDGPDFDYIYTHYFTPLFRYILCQTKNREVTEDLIQTVFLKVLQRKEKESSEEFPSLPFFFTIARNTIIDYWKKKKEITVDLSSVIFSSLIDEKDNPQEKLEKEFKQKQITKALETLNYEQKEILTLRFISDLSNKEISEVSGKTEQAIRQIQYRAIKKLRNEIL